MINHGYLGEEQREVRIEIGEQVFAHMNMEGIREGDYMDLEPVDFRSFKLSVNKRVDDGKCVVLGTNYDLFSHLFDSGKFKGAKMRVRPRKIEDTTRNREEPKKT